MKSSTEIGKNRTGIAMSPIDAADIIKEARNAKPSTDGADGEALDVMRLPYDQDAEPLGTVPPPASLKGAVKAAGKALKGESPSVLLDKLGERLAFERTGVRLYEALIHKRKAEPSDGNSEPSVEQLEHFRIEEAEHFELIADCIREMGGDPTVETPSADVVGVLSSGLPKVLSDPRTTFRQGLEAILVAELADNDGWKLLIELAPNDAMKARFYKALEQEDEHLTRVRTWLEDRVLEAAGKG
jgi:rubrerythrin